MTNFQVQLEQVRRRGRWLLLVQPLLLFAAATTVGLILLGWMDFFLRFPAWIRLPVIVLLVGGRCFGWWRGGARPGGLIRTWPDWRCGSNECIRS